MANFNASCVFIKGISQIHPIRNLFKRWWLLGCGGLMVVTAQAADIYVAPNGVATAPGTYDAPTTLQKGVSTAQAGDTVWLKPGTYVITSDTQTVKPLNSGTSTAPITIRAVLGGGDAVIDGRCLVPTPSTSYYPPANWRGLVEIIDRSWIIVDGLKVINSGFYGAYISNSTGTSSNITIRNCVFYNTYGSGVCARNSSNIKVLGNVLQRVSQYPANSQAIGGGECLSFVKVDNFEIAYNTICDRMIDINNGGEGIDPKVGCTNGTIHDNEIYDLIRTGIYTDSWNDYEHTLSVYGNIIHDVDTGIACSSEVSTGVLQNVKIHDNVVRDCATRGICLTGWGEGGALKDIAVYNNTVVRCGFGGAAYPPAYPPSNTGIFVGNTNTLSTNFIIRNNVLANNASQIGSKGQTFVTADRNLLFGTNSDSAMVMTNSITSDPLFADLTNNNFRIRVGSPAIDCALGTPVSAVDILGITRPVNGVVDLGAYEYTGSTTAVGLQGDYYAGISLSGSIVASRQEAVAHGFGPRVPVAGLTSGNYSVRWTGSIEPLVTGTYSFRLRTSNGLTRSTDGQLNQNGVRLWINNELWIDGWNPASSSNALVSTGRMLHGGLKYTIKIEFFSSAGDASAFLDWMNLTQPVLMPVPKERLYPNSGQEFWRLCYFGTTANTGSAADLADPDSDGIPNLMEYALYLDPTRSQTTGLPVVTMSNGHLMMSFCRRRTELTYVVQASDDLKSWTTIATNPGVPGGTVVASDSNTTSPNRFLRLQVTSPASNAVTNPEGRVTLSLIQNLDNAVNFQLNDSIGAVTGKHAGIITTVGSDYVANSSGGWTAGQFSQVATPYWMRITSGAAAGRLFLVSTTTANTSTRLTLDVGGVNLTTLGIVSGTDAYEIFPADTIKSMFPAGTLQSGTSTTGDLLRLFDGSAWVAYYHDGTQWLGVAGGVADNIVVRPDQGWRVTRRGPTTSLVLVGRAPTTKAVVAVPRYRWTYLSMLPVPNTLAELSLQTQIPNWSSLPSNPVNGDHVRIWNAASSVWRIFYYDGTQWQEQGAGVANGCVLTQPGVPFMIVRPASGSGTDWITQAKPY